MESVKPYIFISYRRADTLAAARSLMRFLYSHYGSDSVFMDIAEIRHGDEWSGTIDRALERATVVIPVIGPQWLSLRDVNGDRRIDQANDWVFKEISHAIHFKKCIFPIYIGTRRLESDVLPKGIESLASRLAQVIEHDDQIEQEWRMLAYNLQMKAGFGPLRPDVRYPRAIVRLEPLTGDQLRQEIKQLPGWAHVSSPLPGMEHVTRNELHKQFEFASFRRAMLFMQEASIEIGRKQHHPRWENIWRNVDVWLSTWDIQFQVSKLDIELAHHLDGVAKRIRALPSPPNIQSDDDPSALTESE